MIDTNSTASSDVLIAIAVVGSAVLLLLAMALTCYRMDRRPRPRQRPQRTSNGRASAMAPEVIHTNDCFQDLSGLLITEDRDLEKNITPISKDYYLASPRTLDRTFRPNATAPTALDMWPDSLPKDQELPGSPAASELCGKRLPVYELMGSFQWTAEPPRRSNRLYNLMEALNLGASERSDTPKSRLCLVKSPKNRSRRSSKLFPIHSQNASPRRTPNNRSRRSSELSPGHSQNASLHTVTVALDMVCE